MQIQRAFLRTLLTRCMDQSMLNHFYKMQMVSGSREFEASTVLLSSTTQTMVSLKDIVTKCAIFTNMWKYFWEKRFLQDDRDICGGAKGDRGTM